MPSNKKSYVHVPGTKHILVCRTTPHIPQVSVQPLSTNGDQVPACEDTKVFKLSNTKTIESIYILNQFNRKSEEYEVLMITMAHLYENF